ncbi:MAG: transcriptional repressor [Candidatus Rokubacteria bacterium]|nr:transcriptional repressor [Candidatus Rokubacteria bacterium]
MRSNPDNGSGPRREAVALRDAELRERCRASGLRVTGQRLAVYRVLAADPSHPTAEAVYASLQPQMPSLSRATVYRILESLEREKLIRRVSTTAGGTRFDANLAPHQHLVCRVCGRIADFSAPWLARRAVAAVPGFVVEDLDIRIVGRCSGCRDASVKAHPATSTRDKNPQRRT